MRKPSLTEPSDVAGALRDAIDRTGYYPEVVSDGVDGAVAGEEVDVVLRPPRADHRARRGAPPHHRARADPEPADPGAHRRARPRRPAPAPYTSTSTEAVTLSSVKSVVVNRMVANPESTPAPSPPGAEAVLTIGWGAVGRIDLEPAGCDDPQCEADHGYTGCSPPTTSRCASARPPRVPRPSPPCSASPTPCRRGRTGDRAGDGASSSPPTATGRSATCCPRSPRALGVGRRAAAHRPGAARRRRRTSCSSSTGSATSCCATTRDAGAVPARAAGRAGARHRRRALDHRDQPDLARHRR